MYWRKEEKLCEEINKLTEYINSLLREDKEKKKEKLFKKSIDKLQKAHELFNKAMEEVIA